MIDHNEKNTYGNDDAVCPYCGHVHTDSWEIDGGDGDSTEIDCRSCGRTFNVTINVSRTFTTNCASGEHELVTYGEYKTIAKEQCRYVQCKNCEYGNWCTDEDVGDQKITVVKNDL